MDSFILGMQDGFVLGQQAAKEYKDGLARMVVDMYGMDVLKEHVITFEGVSKTGHVTRIPITESMLLDHEI